MLTDVLKRARATGQRGLVLFDLDSTLLDNRPRQARILREFGAHRDIAPLLRCAPDFFDGWSLKPPMRVCGLADDDIETLEPQAKHFWRERFFTSEYCVDDIAIPGANAYVHRVLSEGGSVIYCTGRHLEMRDGTVDCFRREGFPLPDEARVTLLMKPTFEMHDDDWKRVARDQILARGELIAAFDNEPTHINIYREYFPDAQCVHLLTDESGRGIAVDASIPSVFDFEI